MRRTASFSSFVLAAAFPLAATAQVPLGPEFQVNTYTNTNLEFSDSAALPNGDFVVVWTSGYCCANTQDGSLGGVVGRRFAADGAPLGPEFLVNQYTTQDQSAPSVAALPNGGFVVVWQTGPCRLNGCAGRGQDGDDFGIFGRVFDGSGNGGSEFQVNVYTTFRQLQPSVAADDAGNFMVVWSSFATGTGFQIGRAGIYGRRYDAGTGAFGEEFQVGAGGREPDVATSAAGSFVVTWQWSSAGNEAVLARRFDAAGTALGPHFVVNSTTGGRHLSPAIASHTSGDFVISWERDGNATFPDPDGSSRAIFARQFEADGTPVGGEFQVNTYTTYTQTDPAVAVDPFGGFVVTWHGSGDGDITGVFARSFDAAATPRGSEFRVNEHAANDQKDSSLATNDAGRSIVTWHTVPSGSSHGVAINARLVDIDVIFADGFESGTLGAWSSASEDAGDLTVSSAAALDGTLQGLQGDVDDTAGLFVQDDTPTAERRYRARFWLDPNGFDPGEAQSHFRTRVFIAFQDAPTRRLLALVLKRQGGQYSLMGRARRDDGSQADTGFFPIGDEPHAVELSWTAASAPGANDGTFELWIDGTSVSALTGIDNDTAAVDFVRLGALSVKSGATGTVFWDEFESRRLSYIGP